MNDTFTTLPIKETPPMIAQGIMSVKEEVYKSALKIIKSLCDNYSVTISDIKVICETVLEEKGEANNV